MTQTLTYAPILGGFLGGLDLWGDSQETYLVYCQKGDGVHAQFTVAFT